MRSAPTTLDVGTGLAPARLRRWRRAAGAWIVVVFAASSWPNPPTPPELPPGFPGLDKVTHLALYGVLGFLLYRAIQWPGRPGFALGRLLTVVGALAVLGTVDEIHQVWIPGRGMEGADLLADIAGGLVGALTAAVGRPREMKGARPAA
jgi:VanZ family protein